MDVFISFSLILNVTFPPTVASILPVYQTVVSLLNVASIEQLSINMLTCEINHY